MRTRLCYRKSLPHQTYQYHKPCKYPRPTDTMEELHVVVDVDVDVEIEGVDVAAT